MKNIKILSLMGFAMLLGCQSQSEASSSKAPTQNPSPKPSPAPAPLPTPDESAPKVPSTDVSKPRGSYSQSVSGFYLNHFDNVGLRSSCRDFSLNLSRGGQPDLSKSLWKDKFKNENITYVLDLRSEAGTSEEKATLAAGLGYLWLPLNTSGSKQPDKINYKIRYLGQNSVTKSADPVSATIEIINVVSALTQKGHRVYIHCQRGEDRTGVILGLLRKCDSWYSEFKNYGGSYYESLKWLYESVRMSGRPY